MADNLQSQVDGAFRDAAQAHNIDENWLRAVAQTESAGDIHAVSPAGARGLMQIMPQTARSLGVNPDDPVQSIHGAARLLDYGLKRYGNPTDALRSYNAGTDQSRWGNDETRAYPGKVMANMADIVKKRGNGERPADSAPALDDSVYGWDETPQTQGSAPQLDDSVYGWAPENSAPVASTQPEQSRLGKAWTLTNDTMNAAGREIDRTGAGVSRLLGYVTSAGHRYDNPVSRAATQTADAIDAAEDADEQARAGHYGGKYTNAIGSALGDILSIEGGGRLIRPAAAAMEGNRAGRIASNIVGGKGPLATRLANNALAAGVQGELSGHNGVQDAANAAALGIGGAALGRLAGGGRSVIGSVLNHLDPDGIHTGAEPPSGGPRPTGGEAASQSGGPMPPPSATEQKAQQKAQTKAVSKIGAFTDPKKAADAIMSAFTGSDGTRLYEAQVPGVFHTLATRTRDAKMAGLEDNMRDLYPDAFRTLEMSNNDAYLKHMRDTIGTPEQIRNLEAERSRFEQGQRTAAFENEQPVPVDELHATLDRNIADARARPSVQRALNAAKSALTGATDEDGTATPTNLWELRKEIGYGLQKAAASEDSNMRAAAARLTPFMDDLASHIESGAPGFRDYLEGYSSRSGDIDSQRFLQSRGLTQASNDAPNGEVVNYTALKRLIGQIDKNEVAVSTKGTDAVTPEQEGRLRAIYRDMLAEREMQAAGRSNGASKTFKAAMNQRTKEVRGGNYGGVLGTLGGALGGQELGALSGGAIGTALHTGNALLGHALANRKLTNIQRTDQEVINRLLPQR
ncbi:lytic transglycosylase domain-containing protein [Komagataeibacter medellinensis]|uniref:Lytic transglycosylase domain-containing protein n=1 Tax=Komagataeibacter medellinensis TaxID=1177712 RepID=A0ABQ6VRJ0_9PROT|nr:lytic transglycosylase domain-containing protein [Komagataeibacter medellinensis]KAB8122457.1 lytic transglycosylase domain-containing protein [Komagataeibacter medellinensis]